MIAFSGTYGIPAALAAAFAASTLFIAAALANYFAASSAIYVYFLMTGGIYPG